jgi:uncharacterized protein YuzE
MRWTFDLDADAIYVYLSNKRAARQVEFSDGIVVDLDSDERVVGVEVLSPSRSWDLGGLVTRFSISPLDAESLAWIAVSPLVSRQIPAKTSVPVQFQEDEETIHSSSQSVAELVAA